MSRRVDEFMRILAVAPLRGRPMAAGRKIEIIIHPIFNKQFTPKGSPSRCTSGFGTGPFRTARGSFKKQSQFFGFDRNMFRV
jgi:hypothetical protein